MNSSWIRKSLSACAMAAALTALSAGSLLAQQPAAAPCGGCATCGAPTCDTCCTTGCNWLHCPPPLKHCMVGPPHICFVCGCPKPICCPCDIQHFGYYETCWRPWPYARDVSHCPPPVNGSGLLPQTGAIPGMLPGNPGGVDMMPRAGKL